MEDNKKMIEELLENALDYGKTTVELAKLKALDKSSDIVSSFVPHSVVLILISAFVLFLNFGLAFWFGDLLGKTYYGFFVIAAFYCVVASFIHFFMHKRLKKSFRNFFIKLLLK
jgi:hypothetical protein